MTEEKNRRRSPMTVGEALLFAAGALFCLVLVTTAMLSGLFARYLTTGTGEDTARVAAFDVAAWLAPEASDQVRVVCEKKSGSSGEFHTEGAYTITVTSDSEVAVTYDIVVTLDGALPNGITVKLYPEKEAAALPPTSENGTVLTWQGVGAFPAGAGNTAAYDLIFAADWAEIDFTKAYSGTEASLTLDFVVDVTITQID